MITTKLPTEANINSGSAARIKKLTSEPLQQVITPLPVIAGGMSNEERKISPSPMLKQTINASNKSQLNKKIGFKVYDRNVPYMDKLKIMLKNSSYGANGNPQYEGRHYGRLNTHGCRLNKITETRQKHKEPKCRVSQPMNVNQSKLQTYTYIQAHTLTHQIGMTEQSPVKVASHRRTGSDLEQNHSSTKISKKQFKLSTFYETALWNQKQTNNTIKQQTYEKIQAATLFTIQNTSSKQAKNQFEQLKSGNSNMKQSHRRVTDNQLINQIRTDLIRKRIVSSTGTHELNQFQEKQKANNNLNSNTRVKLNIKRNTQGQAQTGSRTSTGLSTANIADRARYQVINYAKYTPIPNLMAQLSITIDEQLPTNRISNSKFSKVQLLESLGTGANANVRLALSLADSTYYAIKIYEKYKLIEPRKKKRVYSEIQLLKSLPQHPNIITMYAAYENKRQVHVIFEYIPNSIALSDYFRKNMLFLQQAEIQQIFGRIARAILQIHQNKVAHRDIKPDNVLLNWDEDGQLGVKIIDFGYAIRGNSADLHCGTPNFMAPELLEKNIKYNPMQVDMWALGITLFYLFEGRYPFRGFDEKDLYRSIRAGVYQFKKITQPHIIALIDAMLHTNPSQRISIQQLVKTNWVYFI